MTYVTALRSVFFRVLAAFIVAFSLVAALGGVVENRWAIFEFICRINFWANVGVGAFALFVHVLVFEAESKLEAVPASAGWGWVRSTTLLVYSLASFIAVVVGLAANKLGTYEGAAVTAMLITLFIRLGLGLAAHNTGHR